MSINKHVKINYQQKSQSNDIFGCIFVPLPLDGKIILIFVIKWCTSPTANYLLVSGPIYL